MKVLQQTSSQLGISQGHLRKLLAKDCPPGFFRTKGGHWRVKGPITYGRVQRMRARWKLNPKIALGKRKLSGHPALKEWDPTYKHHELPRWFWKKVRELALKKKMFYRWAVQDQVLREISPYGLWDHWGSKKGSFGREAYTMPYFGDDEKVKMFAAELDCNLRITRPGPWEKTTVLYIFSKKNENDV